MAACNNTSIIFDSECIGDSLVKINTNFRNLDAGLCQLGQDLLALDAFVKSLSAKDSPTIDMSFSVAGYFLSADVRNDSLGTAKLGVDIPTTTKGFLTAAKITSLTDVSINSLAVGQTLVWSGAKWVNSTITDDVGAKFITELQDVQLTLPVTEGQVLKYNSSINKWVNGPDFGLLRVPDGDYEDINVSGNGQIWNIRAGKVGEAELATNAVTTSKVQNLAIVNDKIDNETIGIEKIAFEVGEKNTGLNVGNGTGLYLSNNADKQLVFRSIRGTGSIQVVEGPDEIEIRGQPYPEEARPDGINLGGGVGVYKDRTQVPNAQPNVLYFKTLRGGQNINISEGTNNDIIISATSLPLAMSIIAIDENGNSIAGDNTAIANRIGSVYSPVLFPVGTLCRVELVVPTAQTTSTVDVSVPFTLQYYLRGNNFALKSPDAVGVGGDQYKQERTLTGSGTISGGSSSIRTTRQVKIFGISNFNTWTFIS